MTDSARQVMRRFAPMIYGPTILFALGEGAVIPLIPVIAGKLGADLALSGLVASALVIGQLVGNLPAGYLVARVGERLTMVGAGTLALLGVVGLALAPSVGVLAASVFLIGMCAAAFGLARHAFMTTRVPQNYRARALSLLGGSFRFGMFAGPFLGAILLGLTGTEASAAWLFAACLIACVLLVGFGPDPETKLQEHAVPPGGVSRGDTRSTSETADTGEAVTSGNALPAGGRPGVFRTMMQHRGVLSRLGLAAASLSAVRSARQVVLPLWGVSLALDAQTISLVVGIAGAIDFALFYASGQVMDRFGRLWAALPAMLLMGTGFIVLAFTHDVPQATMWFAMFAAVIGVGNGLSSGILLTLGADVAPKGDPAPFLGSWRTLTDAGGATAPVLFSGIAAISTLGVATAAMGVIGLVGALGFLRWVPRYIKRPPAEK
ncbi:MFS transporter [Leucobacter sp. W1478]|uniref:MFS transporter n=1 Tax=Leucobacter sp. W1478 TaxID=3439065 RepID=UPI003F2CA5D6